MSILPFLATSLGRRDEVPNQELARQIVAQQNTQAVKELIDLLHHKEKNIQSDSIKVLYEIGAVQPQLIAGYHQTFVDLLDTKNNRLQWGTMMALDYITGENPKAIYNALAKIINIADKGTVITNDHCVGILIALCRVKQYTEDAFALLNERLIKCPTNQLAMYAERALPIINKDNKTVFIHTLQTRLPEMDKEPKRIRIEKVLKKLHQQLG